MLNENQRSVLGGFECRGRWFTRVALLCVIGFGVLLCSTGVGFLLPHAIEPDGQVLDEEVRLLQSDRPTMDRVHGAGLYPQLLSRIAACVVPAGDEVAAGNVLAEHLSAAGARWRNLRLVLALLSVLCIPATWLIARRFLAPGWSLVAAAFVSSSFLSLWFAQQARPHAAAAGFATWAVAAALNLRRRPTVSSYVLAGVAMGLAVGALQSGLAVLLPFSVAVLLRRRSEPRSSAAWALLSLGILVATSRFFYPFVFDPKQAPPGRTLDVVGTEVKLSGHRLDLAEFNGLGFPTVIATIRSYEPMIGALALAGLFVWIAREGRRRFGPQTAQPADRERRADLWVVLAYALPYLLAIGMFRLTYQRFVIPLLPYAACLSAYCLAAIAAWISRWSAPAIVRRAALIASIVVPLGVQSFAAFKLVSIRAEPDTIMLAARWIADRSKPGQQRFLVAPALDLPLFQTETALAANDKMLRKPAFPWTEYQWSVPVAQRPKDQYDLRTIGTSKDEVAAALLADPIGYLRTLHGDFAVVEVYAGWGWKPLRNLCAELRRSCVLVARFTPDAEDRWHELPFAYQEEALRTRISWFARALSAHCTGPVVEIYRLDP